MSRARDTSPRARLGIPVLPAVPEDVTLTTLPNGLTVIVREDHSAPVVSAQAWCRTGSIHEGRWLGAGLSHVLEHMLFKGTQRRGPGRIDQEVQAAGGQMNAYTSFDRTVYWINVPAPGARTAIDILCDVMQHATLPAEELQKELDVIRREMDMNEDDPARRAGRRLFEIAYTQSPYRFTIIGYPDIFNELTPADIHAYYRERYVANNVFFVVVGDVASKAVLTQIQAGYADAKARPLAPIVLPTEPRQTAPRELIEHAAIELGHLHFSWHTPEIRHPDVPLLDVLATLLGVGRSSRLFQRVREKRRLVHSVDAWLYSPGELGLFGMSAVVDGDRFGVARDAMLTEVGRLQRQPVPAAELRKAVKQFLSATLATRKTMQGQAQDLGSSWLAAADLNFSERYLARMRQVQPADLRRVAQQYLAPEHLTAYALLPGEASPPTSRTTKATRSGPIERVVLPNGLRLLLKEDHRLPFVEIRAVLQGGVLAETPADNGVTQLLARLLLKGTRRRTAERIASEIERLGGSIDSYGGYHSYGLNVEVMGDDFATGFNIFAEALRFSVFPGAELDREREMQLAAIRAQRDQVLKSAGLLMRRALFGACGYGLDSAGTEASLQSLSPTAVAAAHRRLTVPNNCVIAIYGDIQASRVSRAVREAFGHWAPSDQPVLDPTAFRPSATPTRRNEETRDKKQAVLVIGFPGTTLADPDRMALDLLQEACSDMGSRLFLRIRERLGLAYYVGAQHFAGLAPGYFAFYAGTAPDRPVEVERELLREAELLATEGLTDEELQRAKAKVIGQKKIARQDLGHLAASTALDELYGLGYDHSDEEDAAYEALTIDQVRAVAVKYLQPTVAVLALICPPTGHHA